MTAREFIDWTICQNGECGHQIVDHRFVGDRMDCFFCPCKIQMERLANDCEDCRCPEPEHRYDWTATWCLKCEHRTAYSPETITNLKRAKCGTCDHLVDEHIWLESNRSAKCHHADCGCFIGDKIETA